MLCLSGFELYSRRVPLYDGHSVIFTVASIMEGSMVGEKLRNINVRLPLIAPDNYCTVPKALECFIH